MKSNVPCASKVQWRDRHRIGIPSPKRNTKKEIEAMDSEQIQNLKARWCGVPCLLDILGQRPHFLGALKWGSPFQNTQWWFLPHVVLLGAANSDSLMGWSHEPVAPPHLEFHTGDWTCLVLGSEPNPWFQWSLPYLGLSVVIPPWSDPLPGYSTP